MNRMRHQEARELLTTASNCGFGSGPCCDGYFEYFQYLTVARGGPSPDEDEGPSVVDNKPDNRRLWQRLRRL